MSEGNMKVPDTPPKGFKVMSEQGHLRVVYRKTITSVDSIASLALMICWTSVFVHMLNAPLPETPGAWFGCLPIAGGEVLTCALLAWVLLARTEFVLAPKALEVTSEFLTRIFHQ